MEEPTDDRDRSRSRSPQTQRDMGSSTGTAASRFHLGGLGSRVISEKDLTDFFGKMVSSEITDVVIKHHKGFGYIEFERTSQYEESKLLGKHVINGRNVECKRAKPREQIQIPEAKSSDKSAEEQSSKDQSQSDDASSDKSASKRYFIGGINSTLTQGDLMEYFRQYGVIVDVLLLFHKGFGYIEFSKITNYEEAKIIGTHHIKGRSLEVKRAKPKGPPPGPHSNAPLGPIPGPLPTPPVHQAIFNSQHHPHHGRDHPGPHNVQDSNSPRYFLGGVSEDITHQNLKDYFKQFGPLIDVTIIPNKSIGYIQYRKSSEVVEAEREDKLFHQKHQVKNKLINCSRANPKQNYGQDFNFAKHQMPPPFARHNFHAPDGDNMHVDQHIQEGGVSPRRFFLGGVNAQTTRADLMEYFTKYGEIINLMIFESKNYGYIEFKRTTPEDDTQRESVLIGEVGRSLHTISGVPVTCKRAIPRSLKVQQSLAQASPHPSPPQPPPQPEEDKQDDSKFKMFVGGLGLLTEEQLREYFSKMGEIDNIILLRGFGFITFKSPVAVDQAIQEAKVINGKTMHCINGKYVECKRTFAKAHKKGKPGGMMPGHNAPFPSGGPMPHPPTWNNFNPEAPPFTPNAMQHQQQQQPQQQQQQNPSQPQQFPQQTGYFPQGQGGPFPAAGQMQPQQGYAWNNYGMMPQQGYDMNNPGVMQQQQQGYDMNNAAMMGQQGYDMNNQAMMAQGYAWNNAGMQYVDWNTYMAQQQNYDWNSGVAYNPYYGGQTIQFPDFVTGETSSSMNASEQGSTSGADNDNSSASTPTQDSQQTASSNMDERTEEISDNTSSMSIQSVLSKYATSDNPPKKTVHSVLSKYSVVPSIQTDYSSGEHDQDSDRDQATTQSGSGNNRRLYHNRSTQQNQNGGDEDEEEEEWFEGDLEAE